MSNLSKSMLATLTALSVSLVSTPIVAAPPESIAAPTTIKKVEVSDNMTEKGRDLYLAIFFDTGKYSGKLTEVHVRSRRLFVDQAARLKRDPERLKKIANYLESQGDKVAAESARLAADALSGKSNTRQRLTPERAQALLLDAIAQESPQFFVDFARAVTSGDAVKVDRALIEAATVTTQGLTRLKRDGHEIRDVTVAPGEDGVLLALVFFLFINIALTIDIKDTPDKVIPKCENDDCGCQAGGDCEFKMPRNYMERKKLAKLVSERFAAV